MSRTEPGRLPGISEGAGDVAIRLGYEKRGADLEAFVENTGNHSAAPGRHGRRDQRLRPAAAGGESQSARLLRGVLPGPALRSSASPGAAAAPAMAPRRRASPGVAVACCWLLTGERPCFSLSISCARGARRVKWGGRCAEPRPRQEEGAPLHFRALQVVWAGWNTERNFCVFVFIGISFDVVSKCSTATVGGRQS